MKLIIYTVIAFLHIGCSNNNSSCVIRKDDFLKKSGGKVFGANIVNGKTLEFGDKGTDSIVGGFYTFFDNGNLKSYQYFVDDQTYIYGEEYDSLGHQKKMDGNPSVRKVAKLERGELLIKLYLFALNKTYSNIYATTNLNQRFNIHLVDDSLYSNLKVAAIRMKNLQDGQQIKAYFHIEYQQNCNDEVRKFGDTVSLHYYFDHK